MLSENAKARKKNFAVLKAVQAAEIAANTTTEISNIFKGYSALGPFGQALAIVQAAIAAARGASAIARINSTEIQGGGEVFADGGPVFGPSHNAGGIPFSVRGKGGYEMEGNEIILTKGVYEDPVLRGLASDLNAMGGGRRFALGGPVLQDRGIQPTNTPTSSANRPELNQLLNGGNSAISTQLIEMYLAQIAAYTRATAEKPVLTTTRIRKEIQDLNEIEEDARI
ncbi:hypothetical protein V8V91_08445 [Algoriphagus halophilus]|uniref:hypothetical protein n=1 Tax=Algoriphagus halophilus TaxID=226505 RepID=UPI00358E7FE5